MDEGTAATTPEGHAVTAPPFPIDGLVVGVFKRGDLRVVSLPIVVEVEAAARGGDLGRQADLQGPTAHIDLVGTVVQ